MAYSDVAFVNHLHAALREDGPVRVAEPERVCEDPDCDHNGSGRGRYADPCSWCGFHDCDLDCNPPEYDE